jgi:hypothetical protein
MKSPKCKSRCRQTFRDLSHAPASPTWKVETNFTADVVEKEREDPHRPDASGSISKGPLTVKAVEGLKIRQTEDPPELDEILQTQETLPGCRKESVIQWLKGVYHTSRGFELGTFDSSILATTIKAQSSKWTKLALVYMSDIVALTHGFITKLLALICMDERVTRELISTLTDGLIGRYLTALNHVRFLLGVERVGTPMTLNHYFNDNLEKW